MAFYAMPSASVQYMPDIPGIVTADNTRVMRLGKRFACPLLLGDILNGRYRLLALLGWGAYSMVWLAVDLLAAPEDGSGDGPLPPPRYVALKAYGELPMHKQKNSRNEERHLRKLMARRPSGNPAGGDRVISLFDAFDHESPIGSHRCLVLEAGGSTLGDLLQRRRDRIPLRGLIRLFRQCVEAVAHIHLSGITHGDIDQRNFVLALPDLSSLSEEQVLGLLSADPAESATSVVTKDGRPLPVGVPPIVYSAVYFDEAKIGGQNQPQIKLVRFRECFISPTTKVVRHPQTIPPELLFGNPLTLSADVWGLGLLLWQLLTGRSLMTHFGNRHYEGQEKFMSLSPDDRRDKLAQYLAQYIPNDGQDSQEVTEALVEVLLSTLQLNPDDRPTAKVLLSHRLFVLADHENPSP